MKLHLVLIGLMLGWGAAVPIGPINLEIIRRNLNYGMIFGVVFGLGAYFADITYLLLFSFGVFNVFTHPLLLKIMGIIGSLILAYFGYSALRLNSNKVHVIKMKEQRSLPKDIAQGYLMTMINPMTILFWISISAQITTIAQKNTINSLLMMIGAMSGILSWILGINYFLHKTHHRLPKSAIHWLNRIGGIILLVFAVVGIIRVVL